MFIKKKKGVIIISVSNENVLQTQIHLQTCLWNNTNILTPLYLTSWLPYMSHLDSPTPHILTPPHPTSWLPYTSHLDSATPRRPTEKQDQPWPLLDIPFQYHRHTLLPERVKGNRTKVSPRIKVREGNLNNFNKSTIAESWLILQELE